MAKVLFYCPHPVAETMAGTAIRYWELAQALSLHHEVVLAVPHAPATLVSNCDVVSHNGRVDKRLVQSSDFLISQAVTPSLALALRGASTKLVLDAYDPAIFEVLESRRGTGGLAAVASHRAHLHQLRLSVKMADAIVCASERQRDLLTGIALAVGRIDVNSYAVDPALDSLLVIVPFGTPSATPEPHVQPLPLRALFGLATTDIVFLWAGGVWDWLDPVTAVRATAALAVETEGVKCVFLGGSHPDSRVPDSAALLSAREEAASLGVLGKSVFFNDTWVPYSERHPYLTDADVGVCFHHDTAETRYSFRTRILDHLWAGLPTIATVGDGFSNLIREQQIGIVTPFNDVEAVVQAMRVYAFDPAERKATGARARKVSDSFQWLEVAKPLLRLLEQLSALDKGPRHAKYISGAAVTLPLTLAGDHISSHGVPSTLRWTFRRIGSLMARPDR